MNQLNRREMMTAMAALAALAATGADAQTTDTAAPTTSRVYRFSEMEEHKNASTGGWSRPVMHGTLPTGEFVEVHETMLPPGKMPHQPHTHSHSEFLLIREGTLEYLNEGKPENAGPGDVIYTAHSKLHGLKNVGTSNAQYFVVAIGVQTKA